MYQVLKTEEGHPKGEKKIRNPKGRTPERVRTPAFGGCFPPHLPPQPGNDQAKNQGNDGGIEGEMSLDARGEEMSDQIDTDMASMLESVGTPYKSGHDQEINREFNFPDGRGLEDVTHEDLVGQNPGGDQDADGADNAA
jgi:hypothetical protein